MTDLPRPERTDALNRMVEALETAKRARSSGFDVRQIRQVLKEARAAFEAGDYQTATRLADQILELCRAMAVTGSPGPRRAAVVARMREALRAAKRAKRSGFNVQQAREVLERARAAYEAGDYKTAMELANQALELSGFSSR